MAGKFSKPAVESLVTAMSARLRRHSPFDGMKDDALCFVAERIFLVITGAPRPDRGMPGPGGTAVHATRAHNALCGANTTIWGVQVIFLLNKFDCITRLLILSI